MSNELSELVEEFQELRLASGLSLGDFAKAIQAVSGVKTTEQTLYRILHRRVFTVESVISRMVDAARELVEVIIPLWKATPELHSISPEAVRYSEAELFDPQFAADLDFLFAAQDANPLLRKISHVFYKYPVDSIG